MSALTQAKTKTAKQSKEDIKLLIAKHFKTPTTYNTSELGSIIEETNCYNNLKSTAKEQIKASVSQYASLVYPKDTSMREYIEQSKSFVHINSLGQYFSIDKSRVENHFCSISYDYSNSTTNEYEHLDQYRTNLDMFVQSNIEPLQKQLDLLYSTTDLCIVKNRTDYPTYSIDTVHHQQYSLGKPIEELQVNDRIALIYYTEQELISLIKRCNTYFKKYSGKIRTSVYYPD